MKAYIYFNSKSEGLDYNGEGQYVLVTEDDKCIGSHYCSSRGFANHDLNSECEELLNKYGEMGWEIVGYDCDTIYLNTIRRTHHFILKREKK